MTDCAEKSVGARAIKMMNTQYEIIDFHTHPFLSERTNICSHREHCRMSATETRRTLETLGISRICGSVIGRGLPVPEEDGEWGRIKYCNDEALALRAIYGDFYIPGFHIHPDYVRESCEEIERMSQLNVRLVGELVPYWHGWKDYSCKALSQILDVCEQYSMVVSFHSMGEDAMDAMVREHPKITFVAAHPGEYGEFLRHMERMRLNDNYYLDLSGYGIFRHGMLRHAIDKHGAHRFLFGSDYPTCNPAMYIGGVLLDDLISEREKEMIFSENAKRILGI